MTRQSAGTLLVIVGGPLCLLAAGCVEAAGSWQSRPEASSRSSSQAKEARSKRDLGQPAVAQGPSAAARPPKSPTATRAQALAAAPGPLPPRHAEVVIYGFESGTEGWEIPDWAKASADYMASRFEISRDVVKEGRQALAIDVNFPGGRWTGAYVEREPEVTDWTPFSRLLADVYLPPDAPTGLEARLILTVGEQWQWTEMNRALPLPPGVWTTIAVDLTPKSLDWKFFPDEQFRGLVRKVGVRLESNGSPAYRGVFVLDNIRLTD